MRPGRAALCAARRPPPRPTPRKSSWTGSRALVELVPKRLSEAAAQAPGRAAPRGQNACVATWTPSSLEGLKKAPTERYPNAQAWPTTCSTGWPTSPSAPAPTAAGTRGQPLRAPPPRRRGGDQRGPARPWLASPSSASSKPTVPSAPNSRRGTPPTIRRPAGLHARRLCSSSAHR